MDSSNAVLDVIEPVPEDSRPAAILRGTARGLEVVVNGASPTSAITAAIAKRIDEAPSFFRGSNVRIRVEDGPLAPGCLAKLDELAVTYDLRIVEITAHKPKRIETSAADADAVPVPENLAAGSAPARPDVAATPTEAGAFTDEEPTNTGAKIIFKIA